MYTDEDRMYDELCSIGSIEFASWLQNLKETRKEIKKQTDQNVEVDGKAVHR